MTHDELIWLVGYLEGEGCFTKNRPTSLAVQVSSVDEDVIQKVATMIGGNIRSYVPDRVRKDGQATKRIYQTGVYSAKATMLMLQLLPLMGERRTARIKELLTEDFERRGSKTSNTESKTTPKGE